MKDPDYLGNRELLNKQMIGFFSSRTTAPLSVMPTLDWAHEVAKEPNTVIMSGFQSPMEREVLDILLKGKCSIIYILNRSIYRSIPPKFIPAFTDGRILFISFLPANTRRPSTAGASTRNAYIASTANSLVFSSISPLSSLYSLFNKHQSKIILKL